MAARVPSTTANVAWGERILQALADTSLNPFERPRVVTLVVAMLANGPAR